MHKNFLALLVYFLLALNVTAEERIFCGIDLIFTHDNYGPAAEYHLKTQITNRTGRSVSAVSTLFYDVKGTILGNAELNCDIGRPPLKSGSTGQCSVLLQTIDGKMMEKFGTSMWTEIVNVQLERLISIKQCEVEGYRYTVE